MAGLCRAQGAWRRRVMFSARAPRVHSQARSHIDPAIPGVDQLADPLDQQASGALHFFDAAPVQGLRRRPRSTRARRDRHDLLLRASSECLRACEHCLEPLHFARFRPAPGGAQRDVGEMR